MVPPTGTTNVNVTWTVSRTRDPAGGGIVRLVTSSNASLIISGATVGTLGGSLSQSSAAGAVNTTDTLRFSETLSVSPAMARRIANANPGTVTIERTFTDQEAPNTGTIRIAAGAGAAGELNLRRIELSFENDKRSDVVNKGDTLRAIAEVSFQSNGLLRGEWRIVDPTASLGQSTGRLLQVVRQQLVSSGQGQTRIISPPLPTNINGLHLVSFVVDDTDTTITTPEIRYFVLESLASKTSTTIDMLTPAEGANLNEDTVFTWKPIAGATAYQLEIFETNSFEPLSGKLVPGKDVKMNLTSMSLDNLQPGTSYEWHMRAFGKGGSLIGMSPKQVLFMP